jgi:hypothetical protein
MLEYGSSYLSGPNLSFGFLKGKHAIIAVVSSFIGRHFYYTEIRRFLTSAANHEISKSQSGLFIPNGICLKISGGGFIQEGSDNVV